MPAIADRAVWEKITKGQAGVRWDNVVEKIGKELGGDKEEVLSIEKFGGYKTDAIKKNRKKGKASAENKVKEEKHLETCGRSRGDIGRKRICTAQWTTRKS